MDETHDFKPKVHVSFVSKCAELARERHGWCRTLVEYSVAASAVVASLLVKILLEPMTTVPSPWVLAFTAVVVATMFCGAGPGIFATLLAATLGAIRFAMRDEHTISEAVAQAVLFSVDGFAVVYLGTLIVRGRQRAEMSAAVNARNEERLRLATEAAQVGSYEVDLRNNCEASGTAELYKVLGVPARTQLGEILARVHPDDRASVDRAHAQSLEPTGDGGIRLDVRLVRRPGEVGWVAWRGRTYFQDGVAVRQLGVVVDITDRKRVEAEALDSSRKKDAFLAILAHELRNPLAAIRSAISLIDLNPGGESVQRAHRVIDRQVTQLTRLVDDLLDVTRISRGKLELQRVSTELGELAQRICEDEETSVQGRGVMLELHRATEQLWLDADAARLTQALGNLIHNAAKFTPRGGRIAISLARDQDCAVLTVRDTGAGITAEDLPRLFEPFVQLRSARANGGLGLGLTLVKSIVELHGGTISAASPGAGLGSEFTIRLPLGRAPEPAIEEPAPHASHHRVLLIEDNKDVADSLADVLRMLGHDVRVASDGPSGIAAASEFHPDAVLCDIGLPGIDGYEVARRLRAGDAAHGAMLVALSGYGQPEDRKRSSAAGFSAHIVKPATIEALRRTLA
jgi:PAS domain S-box-containing protein